MIKKILSTITLLIVFFRASVFGEILPLTVYYIWFSFLAFLIVTSLKKEKNYNYFMILFLFVAFISILLNEIDPIYMSTERLISFFILIVAIGPLLENNLSVFFKIQLFNDANKILIFFTFISFLGYLIKLPLFFNTSGYRGLLNHSMLLGPIAALSAINTINYFVLATHRTKKIVFISLFFISILMCIAAASRGAIVALVISLLFYGFILFRTSIWKLTKVVMIFVLITISTTSIWMPFTEKLVQKQATKIQTENILSDRDRMWIDRIMDFKESPIYGVGFASFRNTANSKINNAENIEPGTSWLMIFSSTGILGLIAFMFLIIHPIFQIFQAQNSSNKIYPFMMSILIFFIFHLAIEGYALSAGGVLFFYMWLTIALSQKRIIKNLHY